MEYILTKKQLEKILTEGNIPAWFKRRVNPEYFRDSIDESIEYAGSPCDYSDEFEYADNVISYTVNRFLTIDEEIFESDRYDEFEEILLDMLKEEYGEELFDIYRSNCEEDLGF